ncbi:MAG TPA: outer membrane beta-barrel protein [Burkholderiales bacterium]
MKNKAVLAFLGFLAALTLALPAMAQKSTGAFYVGAAFGQSTSDSFCENVGPPCKDQDQTWKVMGGYELNRYFAVEAAFSNLGAPHDNSIPRDDKAQAMEFVGILSYPFLTDFAVYGKLGGFHGRIRGSNAGASFNESNTDITYGLGLQWNIIDQFALRAEVQRYPRMGGGGAGAPQDIAVWSVGGIIRFR